MTLGLSYSQDYFALKPGTSYPIRIGLSGGVNYSNISNDIISSESIPSGQFSLYFDYRTGSIESITRSPSVAFGIGFNNRIMNLINPNNIERKSSLNYLTVPLLYQYPFWGLDKENKFSAYIIFGSSLNFYISQSTNRIVENPHWLYVGVLIGSEFEYEISSNLSLFLDYRYEFGGTDIQDIDKASRSTMHLINIGFKVPSTSIY